MNHRNDRRLFAPVLGVLLLVAGPLAAKPTVIDLTQTGCQFIESEGGADHEFDTRSAADCLTINEQTGADRVHDAEPLRLPPGEYVFRVTNRDVPYSLGFWLRGSGLGRVLLPSVSGGGLTTGTTKEYPITLTAGEYRYSCPLNPTPDYVLIVE